MRFLDKPYAGIVGEIRYIYRSWVFIYCRTHVENAGILVGKSRQLALIGGSNNVMKNEGSGARPAVQPISGHRGGGRGGGNRRSGNQIDRSLIGKTARIVAVSFLLSSQRVSVQLRNL